VIVRRLHLALFLVLTGLAAVSVAASAQARVSGIVRDSAGVPQAGTEVQLLRPDGLTVIASVYTNEQGRFAFGSILPGKYAVKAMGAAFLPALRENVHVRTAAFVSITLNTLYEVMQWLPAKPRGADTQKDDWAWTLRSAANRPLLRWLQDGPLVVVTEGPNARPKLKARLIASGQKGTFGEDGQRITMEVENTPSRSRELLARVDFDPSTDAGMESMLGFRQDLGMAGSVESMAAVSIHPEIASQAGTGLEEAAIHTAENIQLGDLADAEVGVDQALARFAQSAAGAGTVVAALPFATVGWNEGNVTIRYAMATAVPADTDDAELGESQPAAFLPEVAVASNNRLAIERGFHQQLGWERRTDSSGMQVVVFADSLDNPVLEAAAPSGNPSGQGLYDSESGLLRVAATGFSTAGVVAMYERRVGESSIRLSYANGDALVIPEQAHALPMSLLIAAARPRRTQMYALSLSGTVDGTGTRWRASYRWQPEETITRVAPYAMDADAPYLNVYVRQPVCRGHGEHTHSVDAMVDAHNLLAQGYRQFVLTDSPLLVFAQNQRSLSAGLAFTF
jgi:hypothetical protein